MTASIPDEFLASLLSSTSVDAIASLFSQNSQLISGLTPETLQYFAHRHRSNRLYQVALPILTAFLSQTREEGLEPAVESLANRTKEAAAFADLPSWVTRIQFLLQPPNVNRIKIAQSIDWMLEAWTDDLSEIASLLRDCRDLIVVSEAHGMESAWSRLFDENTAKTGLRWLMSTDPWEHSERKLLAESKTFANTSTEIALEQLLSGDLAPEERVTIAKTFTFVRFIRTVGCRKTLDLWKTLPFIYEVYQKSLEDEIGDSLHDFLSQSAESLAAISPSRLRLWVEVSHRSLPNESIASFGFSLLLLAKVVGLSRFHHVQGAMELAIEVCTVAEAYCPKADSPELWAEIVVWKARCLILHNHDKSRRQLQSAVRMLEDCLETIKVADSPALFAHAKYLLGSAALAGGEFGESRFEVSTSALNVAIAAITFEESPNLFIDILHQLGLAYLGWAKKLAGVDSESDRCQQQLGLAIASLESAVGASQRVERHEIIPALALNVAEAYLHLANFHPKEALSALSTWCNAGLNISGEEEDAVRWAQFHLILAQASRLPANEPSTSIYEHVDNVLRILSPQDYPDECFRAGSIAAQSAYQQRDFTSAIRYGEIALSAWEFRFSAETWREKRQAMLDDVASLTALVVACCARHSADPAFARLALIYADAAKSRILEDQMSLFSDSSNTESLKLANELRVLEEQRAGADVVFSDRGRFADPLENPMLHSLSAMIQERRDKLNTIQKTRANIRRVEESRAAADSSTREGGFLDDPLENSAYGLWADKVREQMLTHQHKPTNPQKSTHLPLQPPSAGRAASDWAGIQSLLNRFPQGTLIAEFFDTGSEPLLFLARADWDAPKIIHIGVSMNSLNKHYLLPLMKEILNGGHLSPNSSWSQIGELLLGRAVDDIVQASLLYLIPHGELHQIPIHALTVAGRFLIETVPVCYIPSLSVLLQISESAGVTPFANPRFALLMGYTPKLEEEELFHREVALLGNKTGSPEFVGSAASCKTLIEHAGKAYLIHISCHGAFDPVNPLDSAIRLSDGRFFGRRWIGLDLNADLVTLSCCQSGSAEIRTGDEVTGLARALLIAGARSTILTLWSVPADSTARWMESFYNRAIDVPNECLRGKAHAFQQATLGLIREGYPPISWAPFAMIGLP